MRLLPLLKTTQSTTTTTTTSSPQSSNTQTRPPHLPTLPESTLAQPTIPLPTLDLSTRRTFSTRLYRNGLGPRTGRSLRRPSRRRPPPPWYLQNFDRAKPHLLLLSIFLIMLMGIVATYLGLALVRPLGRDLHIGLILVLVVILLGLFYAMIRTGLAFAHVDEKDLEAGRGRRRQRVTNSIERLSISVGIATPPQSAGHLEGPPGYGVLRHSVRVNPAQFESYACPQPPPYLQTIQSAPTSSRNHRHNVSMASTVSALSTEAAPISTGGPPPSRSATQVSAMSVVDGGRNAGRFPVRGASRHPLPGPYGPAIVESGERYA